MLRKDDSKSNMDRRNFLKTFLGNDISFTLKWAVAILVIILFFLIDFGSLSVNLVGIGRLAALFLLAVSALLILVIILNFISKGVRKLIPQPVLNWLSRNKKIIEYVILIPLTGYLVYWAIKNEKYVLLIFWAVYGIISYIFNKKSKLDEKQTNISADATIRE